MSCFWMTRRSFAVAPPQQMAGVRKHRRRVVVTQLCSVVALAAMKHGYVHTTGVVY